MFLRPREMTATSMQAAGGQPQPQTSCEDAGHGRTRGDTRTGHGGNTGKHGEHASEETRGRGNRPRQKHGGKHGEQPRQKHRGEHGWVVFPSVVPPRSSCAFRVFPVLLPWFFPWPELPVISSRCLASSTGAVVHSVACSRRFFLPHTNSRPVTRGASSLPRIGTSVSETSSATGLRTGRSGSSSSSSRLVHGRRSCSRTASTSRC